MERLDQNYLIFVNFKLYGLKDFLLKHKTSSTIIYYYLLLKAYCKD